MYELGFSSNILSATPSISERLWSSVLWRLHFLVSLFFPRYVSLSALPSSVLFFDCLLPSLIAAFPLLCHLQLISTNNDCNLALVQSYKLIMHTDVMCTQSTHVCVGCMSDDSWMHCNSHLSARGKTIAS